MPFGHKTIQGRVIQRSTALASKPGRKLKMVDEKTYKDVVETFFNGEWHKTSCAISAYEGDVFISMYPAGSMVFGINTAPLILRMSVATFVKIADVLRLHLDEEDEESDIDDMIFERLDDLSEQVGLLQAEHVTPADMQRDRDWWAERLAGVELKVAAASVHLAQIPNAVKRLADLEDRVKALENPKSKFTDNGNRSDRFYVTEYPSDLVAKLINS